MKGLIDHQDAGCKFNKAPPQKMRDDAGVRKGWLSLCSGSCTWDEFENKYNVQRYFYAPGLKGPFVRPSVRLSVIPPAY